MPESISAQARLVLGHFVSTKKPWVLQGCVHIHAIVHLVHEQALDEVSALIGAVPADEVQVVPLAFSHLDQCITVVLASEERHTSKQ